MRLEVRMSAAIVSIRAPVRPWFANSFVATVRMSAFVRSESLVRSALRPPGFFVTMRSSMLSRASLVKVWS